ncbi:unnamed protein product [Rotaria sp. Silwood1]|nr:unnamed protein product [Rotaria sp. Silwood1]
MDEAVDVAQVDVSNILPSDTIDTEAMQTNVPVTTTNSNITYMGRATPRIAVNGTVLDHDPPFAEFGHLSTKRHKIKQTK